MFCSFSDGVLKSYPIESPVLKSCPIHDELALAHNLLILVAGNCADHEPVRCSRLFCIHLAFSSDRRCPVKVHGERDCIGVGT